MLISSNPKDPQNPYSYTPVECIFDDKLNFKTFDYKWKETCNPWKPVIDTALAKRLINMSITLYIAAGAQGYARTDIRMDKNGIFFYSPFFFLIFLECAYYK